VSRGGEWLRDRVAAGVLDTAQPLVTDLVTHSVRHSGAIAPRPPGPERGGGFGLRIVSAPSERSGRECAADGDCAWAALRRTPVTVPSAATNAPGDPGDARPSQTQISQRAGGGQAPATRAGGQP
jgi:hypothetical protein